MGGGHSKPESSTHTFPVAPTSSSAPDFFSKPKQKYLILAFFGGVLLTLLLVAIIFLIIRRCRKCHSSPQVLDLHSDPPIKLSSVSKESVTYASMTFQPSEEKSNNLTGNHSADLDPVVYAQIKVTSPHLPLQED